MPELDTEEINKLFAAAQTEGVAQRLRMPSFIEDLQTSSSIEYQTIAARHLLVQIATIMPMASVGTCFCGSDLRFKGKQSGLYACCTGAPEHCWKIS